jgi:voltage-gated potassium channel
MPSYSPFERRANQIAGGRSAALGLASSLLLLAVVGAVVMRLADPTNYPSLGLAIWWAVETVTTVGYGDVVPHTRAGRIVGSAEMVLGVAMVSLLTASVTSALLKRDDSLQDDRIQQVMDTLTRLDRRLAQIESHLAAGDAPQPPPDT